MVDYQLGIAIDVEAGCPNVDGYAEAANERLIFGDIVGRGEMEVDCLLELASLWGDQDHSGPHARSHDQPIEVKGLVFMCDLWCRGLDFCPLGVEVGQGLRLYRRAW